MKVLEKLNYFKDKKPYRHMRDLSECHIRKIERPGKAKVKVNHLTSKLSMIGEGVDRTEAKFRAYAAICYRMGNHGAATRYQDEAEEARKSYLERLKRAQDLDFGDD